MSDAIEVYGTVEACTVTVTKGAFIGGGVVFTGDKLRIIKECGGHYIVRLPRTRKNTTITPGELQKVTAQPATTT